MVTLNLVVIGDSPVVMFRQQIVKTANVTIGKNREKDPPREYENLSLTLASRLKAENILALEVGRSSATAMLGMWSVCGDLIRDDVVSQAIVEGDRMTLWWCAGLT
jgi:hypothetical protein